MDKRDLIFLGIGLISGAAAGFFATKKYYTDLANREIEEMADYFQNKFNELEDRLIDEKQEELADEIDNDNFTEKINYNKIIVDLNAGRLSTDVAEAEEETYNDAPFVITEDDWIEKNGYEKVILSYFEDDEVFIFEEAEKILENDGNEVFDNGMQVIGSDNLQQFSRFSEEGTLYVRNDAYGTDYMIVLETGSYSAYAGEFEE